MTHLEETQVKLRIMNVYVDDQDRALKFYTEVLGFQKKSDFSTGNYRWLTVVSPQEPDGPELHLETTENPAAKTFQQALHDQNQPAAMFFVDDVQAEYDRMTRLGANFTMPPTKTTGSRIAQLDDTCGNLIQLTQLDWG
jgi:predicted enzyme related to lactoylglutathione lyase